MLLPLGPRFRQVFWGGRDRLLKAPDCASGAGKGWFYEVLPAHN